jgi:hypothetical protein
MKCGWVNQKALVRCRCGTQASQLASEAAVATVREFVPFVNLRPFGLCAAPTNPAVQSATARAQGVPTPAPCVPQVASAWAPAHDWASVRGVPALAPTSQTRCQWGGIIDVVDPEGRRG